MTNDQGLVERLAPAAATHGLRTEVLHDLDDLEESGVFGDSGRETVVLLDIARPGGDPDALLAAVRDGALRGLPSVVLTEREALLDRVAVARAGVQGFVRRTDEPQDVVAAAREVVDSQRAKSRTVLVLDDDPAIHAAVEAVLAPSGLRVVRVEESGRLGGARDTDPDLVVLDLDLPGVGGLDLCRTIRADPRHAALPVLVLTGFDDPDNMQAVFGVGADDFVAKPVVGPELLTRVSNRLERARLHRRVADTDPLTGLADRRGRWVARRGTAGAASGSSPSARPSKPASSSPTAAKTRSPGSPRSHRAAGSRWSLRWRDRWPTPPSIVFARSPRRFGHHPDPRSVAGADPRAAAVVTAERRSARAERRRAGRQSPATGWAWRACSFQPSDIRTQTSVIR